MPGYRLYAADYCTRVCHSVIGGFRPQVEELQPKHRPRAHRQNPSVLTTFKTSSRGHHVRMLWNVYLGPFSSFYDALGIVCIPRRPKRSRPWLFSDEPGTSSWRLFKRKQEVPPTTATCPLPSEKYYTSPICELPYIVAQDWKYAFFLFGSLCYVFSDGFPQGSPVSGSVANLFACVKEHRFIYNLLHYFRQNAYLNLSLCHADGCMIDSCCGGARLPEMFFMHSSMTTSTLLGAG